MLMPAAATTAHPLRETALIALNMIFLLSKTHDLPLLISGMPACAALPEYFIAARTPAV
jgi:hypothetical protein